MEEKVTPPIACIDPAEIARLDAMPSGLIDIEKLVSHMVSGGVAADGAAEVQAAQNTPSIAEREIDIAAQKDQLIAGLREETARQSDMIDQLEGKLRKQTEEYDSLLKHQLALSTDLAKDLDTVRERWRAWITSTGLHLQALEETHAAEMQRLMAHMQPAAGQRRKIETTTHPDIDDGSLTDFINQGWDVVFEAAYVLPAYGKEVCHMVRLEREAQDTAHPPMEAHASVARRTYEDVLVEMPDEDREEYKAAIWNFDELEITPVSAVPGDEPDRDEEIDVEELEHAFAGDLPPLTTYKLNQTQTGQIGTLIMSKRNRGNMQRRRIPGAQPGPQYAPDAVPHQVLPDGNLMVGGLVIDPQKMPYLATMMQHGTEALNRGLNQKVQDAAVAAMQTVQAYKDRRPALPTTLGSQS